MEEAESKKEEENEEEEEEDKDDEITTTMKPPTEVEKRCPRWPRQLILSSIKEWGKE